MVDELTPNEIRARIAAGEPVSWLETHDWRRPGDADLERVRSLMDSPTMLRMEDLDASARVLNRIEVRILDELAGLDLAIPELAQLARAAMARLYSDPDERESALGEAVTELERRLEKVDVGEASQSQGVQRGVQTTADDPAGTA